MQTLAPAVQEGTAGSQAVAEMPVDTGPVLDGPEAALWLGFGGGLLVFFLILLAIIRGRVVKPAQAKQAAADANFFEPAGEDADITFDEPADFEPEKEKRGLFGFLKKRGPAQPRLDDAVRSEHSHHFGETHDPNEAEIIIERAEEEAVVLVDDTDEAPSEAIVTEKKRSAFSGLFRKKHREPDNPVKKFLENGDKFAGDEVPVDRAGDDLEPEAAPAIGIADRLRKTGVDEDLRALAEHEADRRRQAEAEMADEKLRAEREIAAADQRAELAAESARSKAEHGAASLERERLALANEAAEQSMQSLQSTEATLTERFETLSRRLEDKFAAGSAQHALSATSGADDNRAVHGLSEQHFMSMLEDRFAALQDSLATSISDLSRRVDAVSKPSASAETLSNQLTQLTRLLGANAASATAAKVQLTDLIQSALPAGAYVFRKKLANGRTADCVVDLPHAGAEIAIDAQFPIEAFDKFVAAQPGSDPADHAQNEFRSAVLRHIVGISEKYIIEGETASSALMFIPSETVYSEIQARFPDLVQDSYNAHVWMVSPTTLMATLHTVRELLREAALRDPGDGVEDGSVADEIQSLRSRVLALETLIADRLGEQSVGEPAVAQTVNPYSEGAAKPQAHGEAAPAGEISFTRNDATTAFGAQSLSPEEEAFERLERIEAEAETHRHATQQNLKRPPFPLR